MSSVRGLTRGAAEGRLGGELGEAWRRGGGAAAGMGRGVRPSRGRAVARLAEEARADWARIATARARRAAVMVTAPVGLFVRRLMGKPESRQRTTEWQRLLVLWAEATNRDGVEPAV